MEIKNKITNIISNKENWYKILIKFKKLKEERYNNKNKNKNNNKMITYLQIKM